MGNFYVNFSVRGAEQQQVAEVLRREGRSALVTEPRGDFVVVFDEEADRQGTEAILAVGELLSREAGGPVLAVLNHDDDILCYWLFQQGGVVDAYNSRPDYFDDGAGGGEQGGDAERLCTALHPAAPAAEVERLLRGEHVFAVEQHGELAKLLGLPNCSVGFGYEYANEEEVWQELDAGQVVRVP